ncbi:probable protein phosphatase 2C 55 [Gastrolobium bilobum]|uniref:probable protein phosphatase 2C 55 n=1 Tax=Gastrolobium bilobum TaxID=150636 RepID=UPI002AAFCCFA|nr:probable protein phosphatase 2C 55 [Gastrolobium bilobum]
MAASASNALLLGDDVIAKPTGVYFRDRTRKGCLRATVNLRRSQPLISVVNFICSTSDASWRISNLSSLHQLKNSSFACYSAEAARDVEQLPSSNFSIDQQTNVGRKSLTLFSGSCYLPHPDKEDTGGEDAHFICTDEQAIGVADGVGGWADVGVNAGLFARELMSNSVRAIAEEPKGSINPARVLEKAHSNAKAKGSSTACIIALTDKGLQAINLGDSGFIVVRDGCTIFRSPVQQHDFNFTYQLESGNGGDLPSSGEVFTIPVAPGDVVIAGTDGLFDNLYNNEVTAIVLHAVRAGLEPQVTAQKIAALARQRAQDRNRQTPFSTAAQEAGFRYYGGKLDDITVVVSYITSSVSVSFLQS